jgi:nucleotide-binding universal stress UspA family protein
MFGARLHVLHIADNLLTAPGLEFYGASVTDLQGSMETAARRQLEASLNEEDRTQLGAVAEVRTASNIAQAIVDYANNAEIDLIVMGTHGRGGIMHLLMGSVAERVVRLAPCPVLTVRHPGREFLKPDALAVAATA